MQRWQDWLSAHTSFAFHGQQGSLSVVKETRPRGGGYWYAYRTHHKQTRKRYLGPTSRVTLERLEQEALALSPRNALTLTPSKKHGDVHKRSASLPASSQIHEAFIGTKYAPPRAGATLVQRERLFYALDMVFEHRVLVVSASAGSGKTTLLSVWAGQS